jgi:hypothetical protein
MTRRLELGPKLTVVVDLAVVDDHHRPVLVRDRLLAAVEIDDAEPPIGETERPVDVKAVVIGAAVPNRLGHVGEHAGFDRVVRPVPEDPADPAHAEALGSCGLARDRGAGLGLVLKDPADHNDESCHDPEELHGDTRMEDVHGHVDHLSDNRGRQAEGDR